MFLKTLMSCFLFLIAEFCFCAASSSHVDKKEGEVIKKDFYDKLEEKAKQDPFLENFKDPKKLFLEYEKKISPILTSNYGKLEKEDLDKLFFKEFKYPIALILEDIEARIIRTKKEDKSELLKFKDAFEKLSPHYLYKDVWILILAYLTWLDSNSSKTSKYVKRKPSPNNFDSSFRWATSLWGNPVFPKLSILYPLFSQQSIDDFMLSIGVPIRIVELSLRTRERVYDGIQSWRQEYAYHDITHAQDQEQIFEIEKKSSHFNLDKIKETALNFSKIYLSFKNEKEKEELSDIAFIFWHEKPHLWVSFMKEKKLQPSNRKALKNEIEALAKNKCLTEENYRREDITMDYFGSRILKTPYIKEIDECILKNKKAVNSIDAFLSKVKNVYSHIEVEKK